MTSLRDISRNTALKFGFVRDDLPTTIQEEIEFMESRVKLELGGRFANLEIVWSSGQWSLTLLDGKMRTLKITAGSRNCLGFAGGEMFLKDSVRKVVIDDFKIDLDRRKVVFSGTADLVEKHFRSIFSFSKNSFFMRMKSEVSNPEGGVKVVTRLSLQTNIPAKDLPSELASLDVGWYSLM